MEARGGDGKPWDTTDIRAEVTRSLASLPVFTLHDVGQVSSALGLSTVSSDSDSDYFIVTVFLMYVHSENVRCLFSSAPQP